MRRDGLVTIAMSLARVVQILTVNVTTMERMVIVNALPVTLEQAARQHVIFAFMAPASSPVRVSVILDTPDLHANLSVVVTISKVRLATVPSIRLAPFLASV